MIKDSKISLQILKQMYEKAYKTESYSYEMVLGYYLYLKNVLELEDELLLLGITSTKKLRKKLLEL